jgi:hypothetical protein
MAHGEMRKTLTIEAGATYLLNTNIANCLYLGEGRQFRMRSNRVDSTCTCAWNRSLNEEIRLEKEGKGDQILRTFVFS